MVKCLYSSPQNSISKFDSHYVNTRKALTPFTEGGQRLGELKGFDQSHEVQIAMLEWETSYLRLNPVPQSRVFPSCMKSYIFFAQVLHTLVAVFFSL